MTATLELETERRPEPPIGPRERRRLEQARRSRRRYRRVALVAAAVLALVGLVVATVVLVGAGPRLATSPGSGDVEATQASASGAPADAGSPAGSGEMEEAESPEGSGAPEGAGSPADPAAADDDRVRLQLLNGVGTPGVADAVEDRLPEGEFRVVVADNAPEFGIRETRLLVYDDDPASLAAAERLREVLGAGTISVSRQPQSVVDVTVIIGRDLDGS